MKKLLIGHTSGNIELRTVKMQHEGFSKLRVLYLSDLHFNKHCWPRARQLAAIIKNQNPDILLLGGDYVDTRSGIAPLRELLAFIQGHPLVFAVAGNHDYFFGIEKIKNLLAEYGLHWIENSTVEVAWKGQIIRIDGNRAGATVASAGLQILCLHQPLPLPSPENPYQLILAGHLHGSQLVFWQNPRGLFPGRWFYRWNILEKQIGACRYIVSRGVGDTLPVRYNCAREVVLVEISNGA